MPETPLKDSCPCGSGKPYFRCCGALDGRLWTEVAPGRLQGRFSDPELAPLVANQPSCSYNGKAMPPGMLIKDLDSSYDWQSLARALINTADDEEAKVKDQSGNTQTSAWRVTDIVDQGAHADNVTELVRRAYRDEAEPFYRRQLKSLETPHILRYRTDSYYRPHADSDQLNPDTHQWEKIHDRDLSLLIYLDDDYEGGELAFPNFDFKLRPHAGLLVIFPSDFRYLHGAMPVTRGIRHAIVSWCALKPLPEQ